MELLLEVLVPLLCNEVCWLYFSCEDNFTYITQIAYQDHGSISEAKRIWANTGQGYLKNSLLTKTLLISRRDSHIVTAVLGVDFSQLKKIKYQYLRLNTARQFNSKPIGLADHKQFANLLVSAFIMDS